MTSTSPQIEDHAFLSDQRTGALVTRDGTISWLCMPRFDSPAFFCSLLGESKNGHWSLAIVDGEVVSRRYRPGTLILETQWESPSGKATVTEFMPIGEVARYGHDTTVDTLDQADLVRFVECTEGSVDVFQSLRIRFDYGEAIPWVHRTEDAAGERALVAVAGGDAVVIHGPDLKGSDHHHSARTTLRAGESQAWSLTWFPSWDEVPPASEVHAELEATTTIWTDWLGRVRQSERYSEEVERSLLVLRGLTHRRTAGIVAAATTSLPEDFGGERNWDYRFCWLRDASLSLEALLAHGHVDAARDWREWLLRAIAGEPRHLQIMYTVGGDRELPEKELEHLSGYDGSRPVRVGNGAVTQYQADVTGEVMIALAALREQGVEESPWSWPLQKELVRYTISRIDEKDQGLWEMRGEPAYFTQGRVMIWAALDRAVQAVEKHGMSADAEEVEQWKLHRDAMREEILTRGVDENGAFTQTYGSTETDASLLQIPHTGFLPADDPHMLATVARIEQDLLTEDGLVKRYRTLGQDGLSGDEHPFLVCCFWLVEQYARSGRTQDAEEMMDRTMACANDLFLMAEEYDGSAGRMAGNFPQAFSHLGMIRAADALEGRPVR